MGKFFRFSSRWSLLAAGLLLLAARIGRAAGQVEQNSPIPDLIAALDSDDINQWSRACDFLGRRGDEAKPAVPALIRALDNDRKRGFALAALRRFGPAAKPAIPALVQGLTAGKPNESSVRWSAAIALAAIGPAARPALLKAKADPDLILKIWAHAAIAAQDSGIRFADEMPFRTQAARDSGARLASPDDPAKPGPDLAFLVRLMNDRAREPARDALAAIQMLGPAALPALTDLKAARDAGRIKDMDYAEALRRIGPPAARESESLVPALQSSDPMARLRAVQALAEIGGPESEAVLPALRGLAGAQAAATAREAPFDPMIRATAIRALARIETRSGDSMPTLIAALESPDARSRNAAITAIATLDVADPRARPGLIAAMVEPNLSNSANLALVQLGPVDREVVRAFIEAVRRNAEEFRPGLSYRGPDGEILVAAPEFFLQLTPANRDCGPDFLQLARDFRDKLAVEGIAYDALGRIDALSEDMVPLLLARLRDPDSDVWASTALRRLGTRAAPAVPQLTEMLEARPPAKAYDAVQILEAIGHPAADPAIPALEALSKTAPPNSSLCETLLHLKPDSQAGIAAAEALAAGKGTDVVEGRGLLLQAGYRPQLQLAALAAIMNGPDRRSAVLAINRILLYGNEPDLRREALARAYALQGDPAADDWSKSVSLQGFKSLGPSDRSFEHQLTVLTEQLWTARQMRIEQNREAQFGIHSVYASFPEERLLNAASALARIEPETPEGLDMLETLRSSDNKRIRVAANLANDASIP